ncbi:MAG: hypothetical protein E6G41_04405 [Actinobacteria bacterium]|nr:MAG: hypothetical protein E6G41_04405 [Actinomycetota bacterium]
MNSVRTIFNDLVDRRLWPLALALVAALVAVPVLLGGGSKASSSAPPEPIANAQATTGGTAQAAISVSTPSTARKDRPGAVRNPFEQHKVPATSDTTINPQPTQTTAPSGGVTTLPSPSTGASPGYTVTPIVPGSGGGKRDTPVQDVWKVNLRFGEPGEQKLRHDVTRLTPLPSATNPFFVFLGVLSDGKTAVFLISSDATATGDGTCKPDPTQCDTIEMKAGDTEFFDVAQGNAGVVQYELDLIKVFHGTVKGKAAAAKAARRVNKDGKNVVDELKAEGDKSMGRYIYSYKRGVLVRRHASRAVASATASSTGLGAAHTSSLAGTTWGAPIAGQ